MYHTEYRSSFLAIYSIRYLFSTKRSPCYSLLIILGLVLAVSKTRPLSFRVNVLSPFWISLSSLLYPLSHYLPPSSGLEAAKSFRRPHVVEEPAISSNPQDMSVSVHYFWDMFAKFQSLGI
jgi:hypothetical protein